MFEGLARKKGFAWLAALRKAFPKAGVFLVGGIVRDAALKRASKDHDFVVRGVPPEALEAFLAKQGSVNLVGKTFGIYKFRSKGGDEVDVALPRREHPKGSGGYRDVETQSDPALPIEDDLSRRDYTVNAMAWDVFGKKLIDPHGGWKDLRARKLRAVGAPAARFAEDRSRILRGLRFAVTLGFDFEPSTWKAVAEGARFVSGIVPREIISREFLKSLADDPARGLILWHESGALRCLLPELDAVYDEALRAAERLRDGESASVTLAALAAALGPARAAGLVRTMRMAAADGFGVSPELVGNLVEEAEFLSSRDPAKTRLFDLEEAMNGHGADALAVARAAGLKDRAANAWKRLLPKLKQKPLLTGADVQELLRLDGPSPKIGEILRDLRRLQLDGKVANRAQAKKWLGK